MTHIRFLLKLVCIDPLFRSAGLAELYHSCLTTSIQIPIMKKLTLLLVPSVALFLFANLLQAQAPVIQWDDFYPPDYESNNFSCATILEEPSGGIVVVGSRRFESQTNPHNEVLVMRLDSEGECLWYKSFGGIRTVYKKDEEGVIVDTLYYPWDQIANDMVITPAGNYLITGFRDTTSIEGNTPRGLLLMEVSPAGDLIFDSLYYKGPGDELEGYSISPTGWAGGYVIAGSIRVGSSGGDHLMMLILNRNQQGHYDIAEPLIQKMELGLFGYPRWVRRFEDGYLLAGTRYTVNSKDDLFLLKTGKDLVQHWARYFDKGNSDAFTDAAITAEHIYLAGYAKVLVGDTVNLFNQIYVLKTDHKGDTIWTRTYGGRTTSFGVKIEVGADGNPLIAGHAYDASYHSQMFLLKVDAGTGDSLWMQTYGSFYSSGVSDMAQATGFGYLVSGRANYTSKQDPRIYIMRLDNSDFTANLAQSRGGLDLPIEPGTVCKDIISFTGDQSTLHGVCVKIESLLHPSVGDLEITLEHENTIVKLVDRPLNSGENFVQTFFSDAAGTPLEYGFAPYSGWFRPEEALAPFMLHAPTGQWTLSVTDHGMAGRKSTTGVLEGWSLNLLVDAGSGTEVPAQEAFVNFGLEQVRPNPVGLEAVVSFRIPEPGFVKLAVYNQLGQRVGYLANEHLPEGLHERMWHPGPLAPGTYFFHLESGGMISVRKAVLAR